MSFPGRAVAALVAALRSRPRRLLALVLAGVLAGLLWGLAERPRYEAVATVLLADRGAAAEQIGGGLVSAPGPESADRLLELARGERVGTVAAGLLGGEHSGADLIATTSFGVSQRGGAVSVRSEAEIADLAAAAANAFAAALVEEAATIERRRLRSAGERLEERLATLDPLSPEAERTGERLEAIAALEAVGDPARIGREAELPTESQGDRSLVRAAAIGGIGVGGVYLLLLWLVELRRNPVRRPAEVGLALGAAPLAALGPWSAAGSGVLAEGPAAVALEPRAHDAGAQVLAALGLGRGEDGPRALAVSSPGREEGADRVAIVLAATLAARGVQVLLVEAELRAPTLAAALTVSDSPGLADYLAGEAAPREVMRTVAVRVGDVRAAGVGEPGFLVCVPAGTVTTAGGALLGGPRFRTLGDRLQRAYDVVIFAAPPLLRGEGGEAVAATVDGVLLCARLGTTTAPDLRTARATLGDARLLGSVVVG